MDLKDIKAIIDLMKKNSVSEFELERQDFKIRLKRGGNGVAAIPQFDDAPMIAYPPSGLALQNAAVSASPATPVVPAAPETPEAEIRSPMVGTFYRAPSPESGNYVEVGNPVNPETVVCIIEAMKVMNEIKAEVKGTIIEVLVDNAKPVEFGQPMFKIRPG